MDANTFKSEEYIIQKEPYYHAVRDEIEVFESAYNNQLPVLLKGPTGCGKTRARFPCGSPRFGMQPSEVRRMAAIHR